MKIEGGIIIFGAAFLGLLSVTVEAETLSGQLHKAYELIRDRDCDLFLPQDDGSADHGVNFSCPLFPNLGPATTVHELTPYDISVVGAMGDSITAAAGAGADWFIQFLEWRGRSWSVGGDDTLETVGTIPNIIKKYNPNVKGFSIGEKPIDAESGQLNVAVSGSIAQDIPCQARLLIARMENDRSINFDEDWKLITLFIGGNNICRYCEDGLTNSAEAYLYNVRKGLDLLYEKLPRTFVNLVQMLDVTTVMAPLKNTSCTCTLVHNIGCPCELDEASSYEAILYQAGLQYLATSDRYKGKPDFTVVLQPLFTDMTLPVKEDGTPDHSYFAPDCYHFSNKGHKEAAVALWNNMLQPIGEKQRHWNIGESIKCPTAEKPYFYTHENSASRFRSQP